MISSCEVIVFLSRPEELADPSRRAGALAILTADDRGHVARFHFERDRDLALASRALQRRALSACAEGVAPLAWRFSVGSHGRPEIRTPAIARRLRFNVANTRGLAACAVTVDRAIGLDVEPLRDDVPVGLSEQCFAPDEREALASLPALAQPRRFVELWTLKEAYIKARGLGLALPLQRISFEFDKGVPRLTLDPALGDDAATWQLALWSPTPSHVAALCVRHDGSVPLATASRWDLA